MIKKAKLFLIMAVSFAVGCLLLIVLVFIFKNKIVSPKKIANEADQLKQTNARVVAGLNAGEVVDVKSINKDDFLFSDGGDKTQLIVYLDFDCPFSRQYYQTLKSLKNTFDKDLTIAWRHYPLASHSGALVAAQAFECAREQNQALAMTEALFDNQDKNDNNIEGILAKAQKIGLKETDFKECLTSEKYKDKILAQKEEAGLFGVNGVPASFLNGRSLPGAYQFEDFSDATGRQYEGLKTLVEKEIKK